MRKEKLCGIYCIENIVNNKKYIGQSTNIYNRWYKHKNEFKRNAHCNEYLQHSWNKYGKDNFTFYIIELCDKESLNNRECYYIEKYNTTNSQYGYNLTYGGQEKIIFTDEIYEKKSNSLKNTYNNTDLREKRKQDALRQWANPKIKAKILGENNGMFGRKHSEESKRKMSEKRKAGHYIPSNKNLIPVICVETGEVFDCATEAGKSIGLLNGGRILQVCYGNRHTTCGYHWKFLENNIS